ncbi:hypothetical protein JX265_006576 [Neoarthrinium moseri]|uniref:Calcineurin-like phosphoesterase domain-containing protein n=1 Tax=Neoarthrinium moseri TaxID=1658444 RepID=A0A9P9WL98_9PEZI|nr:hypothetical protein JX265_006576 [Neoarthrinium moseri]
MSGLDALLHRRPPSAWQLFLRGPFVFLTRKLYSWKRGATRPHLADDQRISVLCISDTHNSQCELPGADTLIHAGDLTQSGSLQELHQSIAWLRAQSHGVKVVIAGNHDILLDVKRDDAEGKAAAARAHIDWGDISYLEDQALMVTCKNGRCLKIYGSPKSPRHGNWAFQYARHDDVWNNSVPDDTDILITHCPAHAHLDLGGLGCRHLLFIARNRSLLLFSGGISPDGRRMVKVVGSGDTFGTQLGSCSNTTGLSRSSLSASSPMIMTGLPRGKPRSFNLLKAFVR